MKHLRRKIITVILALICVLGIIKVWHPYSESQLIVSFDVNSDHSDQFQIYYSEDGQWSEANSVANDYIAIGQYQHMEIEMPTHARYLRLDLGNSEGMVSINNLALSIKNAQLFVKTNDLECVNTISDNINNDSLEMNFVTSLDSYILIGQSDIESVYADANRLEILIKILVSVLATAVLTIIYKNFDAALTIVRTVWNNKKLTLNLVKSDFKAKYAGNQFGVVWAFVQPMITALIYIFVFQVIGKATPVQTNIPYSLWLLPGIVPWFYFSDGVMSSTNSLMEYSYLVKKVLFNIEILPVIKVLSALIVHIFLSTFVLIIYIIAGLPMKLSMFQIVYYMICNAALSVSIGYLTSALIPFFKDMGQILNVVLMIGMWCCPIMWDLDLLPSQYHFIIKMNPVYYIVNGFRNSYMDTGWIWEDITMTLYFWMVVICVFCFSSGVFCRLKAHFADVL